MSLMCRPEFVGIAICRFVEVDVHEKRALQGFYELDQRGRLARRAVGTEIPVGIDSVIVPAIDALIGPRADISGWVSSSQKAISDAGFQP